MARFLYDEFLNCQEDSLLFDQEELWECETILEVGSGTGIGVLPLIKFPNDDLMPNLSQVIMSDMDDELKRL
jgi:ribosomal protein RSM22 (predicted rRNA methylase)